MAANGYASRLSEYNNKGVVGLPECFDPTRALSAKVKKLAELMKKAPRVVIITGAGISTAAGIRDFRSPTGVWTKEKELKDQQMQVSNNGNASTSPTTKSPSPKRRRNHQHPTQKRQDPPEVQDFSLAQPTLTHRAITKLVQLGMVQYVVTQNVDGLHRKAGLSRDYHCSVHGCCFTEKCSSCQAEFVRDFEIQGMSRAETGRKCTLCQGPLHDTLLDWEDELAQDEFRRAEDECTLPGTLAITLGTSLRIVPVAWLPEYADSCVVVNLQKTPLDDEDAVLVIRGRVDEVMDQLLRELGHAEWKKEPSPPIERVWEMKDIDKVYCEEAKKDAEPAPKKRKKETPTSETGEGGEQKKKNKEEHDNTDTDKAYAALVEYYRKKAAEESTIDKEDEEEEEEGDEVERPSILVKEESSNAVTSSSSAAATPQIVLPLASTEKHKNKVSRVIPVQAGISIEQQGPRK